jgi:D-alanyl-lipoteichoic acid acyltransferase DltB (MBOAT superfamily)
MLFNSFAFVVFFPIVTVVYFLLPHSWRWFWLLGASCYFYMVFIPVYILVLLVTILIDYAAGIWIEKSQGSRRKIFLIVSIMSTCSVLFVFKYIDFADSTLGAIASLVRWNYSVHKLGIILPIGLSFHTFQSLSYVIEVYRGNQRAEHHFGIYALYVMFFPQLVAGPIERPQHLLHQFYEKHYVDYERITDGLSLMLWGFFKKLVIADRLAIAVHAVYDSPGHPTGGPLMLATVFFAFQIYCDFSGYSDIAIGAARVLGFSLMENFHRPYAAMSIGDFWKRWHISLSTWFRDYVYIPLGGNRVPRLRLYLNLLITFLVSGLWHGANWTFVVWGALNGFYLIFSMATADIRLAANRAIGLEGRPRLHRVLRVASTFVLVCLAWIFFRADTVGDAWVITRGVIGGLANTLLHPRRVLDSLGADAVGLSGFELLVAFASITFMLILEWSQRSRDSREILRLQPLAFRWAIYYCLVFAVLIFGKFTDNQFIYFQF